MCLALTRKPPFLYYVQFRNKTGHFEDSPDSKGDIPCCI